MSDKLWTMLEDKAPAGCEAIQDLYSWSLNYDAGKGPFSLFVDIIGWSDDNLGGNVYSGSYPIGWMEADKLANALREWADRPETVQDYVDALVGAETED